MATGQPEQPLVLGAMDLPSGEEVDAVPILHCLLLELLEQSKWHCAIHRLSQVCCCPTLTAKSVSRLQMSCTEGILTPSGNSPHVSLDIDMNIISNINNI